MAGLKGLKVGIAESWSLGGTCVNRGCVPKKLYSYAAHFSSEFATMRSFGWDSKKPNFNWKKLVSNKKTELLRLNEIYFNLAKQDKVIIYSKDTRAVSLFYDIITGASKSYTGKFNRGITTSQAYLPADHEFFFHDSISLVDWLRQYAKTEEEKEEVFLRGLSLIHI